MNKSNIDKKTALTICITYAVIIAVLLVIEFVPGLKYHEKTHEEILAEKYLALNDADGYGKYISENYELYSSEILGTYNFDRDSSYDLKFVYDYPVHKNDYSTMSFTDEELNCTEIPELYMFDPRWGYEHIGNSLIKNNGCSAVCLTMANLYLNHNSDADPVKIANTAEELGATLMWGNIFASRIAEIADIYGMTAAAYDCYNTDHRITEEELKGLLDKEDNVVLINELGDNFGAHMMIVKDYDENGYDIIDPANPDHTARKWTFEELAPEIAYYWEITSSNN